MTFLNPLVLFGLVAASIPIILHLLNLRKLRTIEFSTLTFLKELQQTKIRRLKLKQLILLIIRTLLVIVIVLAFARPALRGTFIGKFGSQANSSVVLIIDDSFSMSATDEYGEYLKQAKDACLKILDLLKDGDEVALIKLSDIPRTTISPPTHDFNIVRKTVSETQISQITRPIGEAIMLAKKLLKNSKNANKEIYVFSDLQRSLFSQTNSQALKDSIQELNERVHYFLARIGTREISNTSVDSVTVTTTILEQNKPVSLFASFRNFSNSRMSNLLTSVYLDGIRTAQRNISMEPYSSGTITFTFIPKSTGFIKGYVEIENDDIEQDNRRYFTLNIPENINVALVANSEEDIKYLRSVLNATYSNNEQSLFTFKYINDKKFSLLDLKNTQVLILSNISSLTSYDAERISNFVKLGGGLIIFPGDASNSEDFNNKLFPILKISSIGQTVDFKKSNQTLSFNKIDFEHPIFSSIFEKVNHSKVEANPAINSPLIYKILNQQSDKHARTIISTSNGNPFLSEYAFGVGKILLFYSAPNLNWTDFPVKGIFAPIVHRSVIYVSSRADIQQTYITGDEPTIKLPNVYRELVSTQEKKYKLISPLGYEDIIKPSADTKIESATSNILTFKLPKLENQGIYEIKSSNITLTMFQVNVEPNESDTRKIKDDEIEKFFERFGIDSKMIHSLNNKDKIQSMVLQTRFGIELWKYFIGIALLLILLEMLIARDSRKKITD